MELWGNEHGLSRVSIGYPPSFYLHLKDPHAHVDMLDALEDRYRAEECRFRTIFGELEGNRILAGRSVAEKIELQTRYAAELYNVDVRQDQRYMAEQDLFPCGERDESRFSPDFEVPLRSLELRVYGDPSMPPEISRIDVLDGHLHDVNLLNCYGSPINLDLHKITDCGGILENQCFSCFHRNHYACLRAYNIEMVRRRR